MSYAFNTQIFTKTNSHYWQKLSVYAHGMIGTPVKMDGCDWRGQYHLSILGPFDRNKKHCRMVLQQYGTA